jgi:hypothetical protein
VDWSSTCASTSATGESKILPLESRASNPSTSARRSGSTPARASTPRSLARWYKSSICFQRSGVKSHQAQLPTELASDDPLNRIPATGGPQRCGESFSDKAARAARLSSPLRPEKQRLDSNLRRSVPVVTNYRPLRRQRPGFEVSVLSRQVK